LKSPFSLILAAGCLYGIIVCSVNWSARRYCPASKNFSGDRERGWIWTRRHQNWSRPTNVYETYFLLVIAYQLGIQRTPLFAVEVCFPVDRWLSVKDNIGPIKKPNAPTKSWYISNSITDYPPLLTVWPLDIFLSEVHGSDHDSFGV
jgi:hypothetical protein